MDILLFGTMGEIGQVVLEDLLGHGFSAVLVDFPQNVFHDEWGYRRGLHKAVERFVPRVILPIGHQLAMSRAKASLDAIVPVADEQTIRRLDGKTSCSALATLLEVPQPRLFSSPYDAEPGNVIFKRDCSYAGSGVLRPKTLQGLLNLIDHQNGAPYLIEEFVEGGDLSVDCLRLDGLFRAQCYETVSKVQGQGPSRSRKIVECPQAVEYAQRILDYMDYHGVCGLDFRVDTSGRPLFLECNPRFCGGIRTQIESGFDIPYLYVSGFFQ